jgi:hypothetical protein
MTTAGHADMQAGCRDCGDRVKAPNNGVKDHHLMDMTLHAGLVTVVMLSGIRADADRHC